MNTLECLARLAASITVSATLTTAALAAPLNATHAPAPPSGAGLVHKVDVIGNDQRTYVPPSLVNIANSIGLIWQRGGGSVCTAFCVGDDIIASNAHCLVTSNGRTMKQLDRFRFLRVPAERRMRRHKHLSKLQLVTPNDPRLSFFAGYYRGVTTERTMVHDWALAKLERPICRGHALALADLSVAELERASQNRKLVMIGYHGDRGLDARLLSPDCRISARPRALVMTHTCDSFKGSSGSPILMLRGDRPPLVVGINVGSVATRRYRVQTDRRTHQRIGRPRLLSTSVINVAVGTSAFRQGLAAFGNAQLLISEGEFVDYQRRLAELGLYRGTIDGKYGALTREATLRLELEMGVRPIGLPTRQLLNALKKRLP